MSKVLLQDGPLSIVEDSGNVTIAAAGSIGGGATEGVVQGSLSVTIKAEQLLKAAEASLNKKITNPTIEAGVEVVEGIVNEGLEKLE